MSQIMTGCIGIRDEPIAFTLLLHILSEFSHEALGRSRKLWYAQGLVLSVHISAGYLSISLLCADKPYGEPATAFCNPGFLITLLCH